jgi:hypothetical protein
VALLAAILFADAGVASSPPRLMLATPANP